MSIKDHKRRLLKRLIRQEEDSLPFPGSSIKFFNVEDEDFYSCEYFIKYNKVENSPQEFRRVTLARAQEICKSFEESKIFTMDFSGE